MIDATAAVLANAPFPAALIFIGAIFLFFAIGGSISESLRVDRVNPRSAMAIGFVFVAVGIGIEIWKTNSDRLFEFSKRPNIQEFTETIVEPAPPPNLRDSARKRLGLAVRDGLRHKAETFLRAMLTLEQLSRLNRGETPLDILGEAVLKFGEFKVLDRKLGNGDPVIEARGVALIDLRDIERRIKDLEVQQKFSDEFSNIKNQLKEISAQLSLVESRYKNLAQNADTRAGNGLLEKQKAQLENQARGLAAEIDAVELYRTVLVKFALGRHDEAEKLIHRLIESAPDYLPARLFRGRPEDRAYLLKQAPSEYLQPHLDEAGFLWNSGKRNEAKAVLEKAVTLFDNLSVMEFVFDYDPSQISFDTIRDSLSQHAPDGSWNRPPGAIGFTALIGEDRVLLWHVGLKPFRLQFGRYGFTPTAIDISVDTLNQRVTQNYKMLIKAADPSRVYNTLSGRVGLSGDASDFSGISVSIYDNWYSNLGFSKSSSTSREGWFTLDGVPNGKFAVKFEKEGYVTHTLFIKVENNALQCPDGEKPEFEPCELTTLKLQLHPVRKVEIMWTLQEDASASHFRDTISEGRAELNSSLPADWQRLGDLNCCGASLSFADFRKAPERLDPDLVVFTGTDGAIYFGQRLNHFIAVSTTSYGALDLWPKDLVLKRRAPVEVGRTYIMKTNSRSRIAAYPGFLVKIKVISISTVGP